MSRARSALVAALVLGSFASCGDAGGSRFTLALSARGSAPEPVAIEGGQLRLSQARVALGPLYLCAASDPDPELCEVALAEWLDATSVDALDPAPVALGELDAISGTVRSALLDYGISWLLAREAPEPSPGAVEGHSALLAGRAEGDDGSAISFEAAIDIEPSAPGEPAFSFVVDAHTLVDGETLQLQLDPNAWVAQIRYVDLKTLDADGDGQVTLAPGEPVYEAIAESMRGPGAPGFTWSSSH